MHFNAVFHGGVLFGVTRFQFDDNRRLVEASFLHELPIMPLKITGLRKMSPVPFSEESTKNKNLLRVNGLLS